MEDLGGGHIRTTALMYLVNVLSTDVAINPKYVCMYVCIVSQVLVKPCLVA